MNHQPDKVREEAMQFSEIVCSPEFPAGCAEPDVPDLPNAEEPDTPEVPTEKKEDLPCYDDDVCSAEFERGCINPLKEGK